MNIDLFKVGDRVCTPDGEGTIVALGEDEVRTGYFQQNVVVQLDEGHSNNTGNEPQDMEASSCRVI